MKPIPHLETIHEHQNERSKEKEHGINNSLFSNEELIFERSIDHPSSKHVLSTFGRQFKNEIIDNYQHDRRHSVAAVADAGFSLQFGKNQNNEIV